MSTRLRRLQYVKVALVDQGANPDAHITLFKRQDMSKTPTVEELQATLAAVTKAEADAKAQVATLEAKVAELEQAAKPAEKPEDLEKALPEKVQKELAALRKQAEEDRAAVAKMQDERDRAAAIRKAADFKALGNPDDLGGLLYDLRKAAPAVADKLETHFKAWHEQLRQSALFKAIGADVAADESTPQGKLEALAKAHRAAHPELTQEQAFAAVMNTPQGTALYKQTRGGQ